MSQPALDSTSSEDEIPSIHLQSSTPPERSAPGDSSDTLVSRIRKEYQNLTQLLPEIDLTEKDRETCSSKLERYEGSFGLNTDEYETLLFFDNTSEVSELLAGIVDIQKLLVSCKGKERIIHEEEEEDTDPTELDTAAATATAISSPVDDALKSLGSMIRLIDKGLGVIQMVWSAPLTHVDLAMRVLDGENTLSVIPVGKSGRTTDSTVRPEACLQSSVDRSS